MKLEKKVCVLKDSRLTYITNYRTRAIITRGLYNLNPLFEAEKRFFKEVFSENSGFMYG